MHAIQPLLELQWCRRVAIPGAPAPPPACPRRIWAAATAAFDGCRFDAQHTALPRLVRSLAVSMGGGGVCGGGACSRLFFAAACLNLLGVLALVLLGRRGVDLQPAAGAAAAQTVPADLELGGKARLHAGGSALQPLAATHQRPLPSTNPA